MDSLQQTLKCEAGSILEEPVPLAPATKVLNLGTRPQLDELSVEPLKYESAIQANQKPPQSSTLILSRIKWLIPHLLIKYKYK